MIRRLLQAWRDYSAAPDSLTEAGNLMALVLGGNQPFYPFYLLAIVGWPAWPSFMAVLGTPLFLAVPAIARRSSIAGRAFLVLVGTANTVFYSWILGEGTGINLFFLACVMLAALLFRRAERWVAVPLAGLPIFLHLWLTGKYGIAPVVLSDSERQTLVSLNWVSVAILIGFMGFVFSTAIAASGSNPDRPAK